MLNWNQVAAAGVIPVVIFGAYVAGRIVEAPRDPPAPSPLASVVAEINTKLKHESDVVDIRTKEYAEHTALHDQWLDDREAAAAECDKKNGVPVFTYGMRMYCVSRTAIIGEIMPERESPKMPRTSP